MSSEIGKRKPEPAAFNAISREIEVNLERILFFDDSVKNIAGAKSVGMQAVHVTSLSNIKSSLKDIPSSVR